MRITYFTRLLVVFSLTLFSLKAWADTPQIQGQLSIDPDNISGLAITDRFMALATDEGTALQILPKRNGVYHAEPSGQITLTDTPDELDLEGLAWRKPYLYAIGSHSKKRKKIKPGASDKKNLKRLTPIHDEPSRNVLFQIRLNEALEVTATRKRSLMPIIQNNKMLAPFIALPSKENGIDIEALAVTKKHLYVGFRGPVFRGNLAAVLKLDLAEKTFELTDPKLRLVNLNGLGIRDMMADDTQLYLLSGPVNEVPNLYQVHKWDGKTNFSTAPPLLTLESPKGKPEGLVVQKQLKSPGLVIFIVQDGVLNGGLKRYESTLK
ncbi:hypothetical protein AVO42_02715 [Thiomicrospira sp. XS5]|uniref:DUF3616 domain-containing protein n=1 Tax=Thiomicrospira sp. XS5 TaxID=1775636 RepID=UPI00074AA6EE|nr:DUF3616 domain-containing protein [Thiomicrospira sp. XS5]KUJ74340.1 hypothetical protein AVO42_02715 [Thiomicrospira sp. XS5]